MLPNPGSTIGSTTLGVDTLDLVITHDVVLHVYHQVRDTPEGMMNVMHCHVEREWNEILTHKEYEFNAQ